MTRYNEDDFAAKVEAAVRKAAEDVVRVAAQTGTPIITWKNGQIVSLPPNQVQLLYEEEAAPPDTSEPRPSGSV